MVKPCYLYFVNSNFWIIRTKCRGPTTLYRSPCIKKSHYNSHVDQSHHQKFNWAPPHMQVQQTADESVLNRVMDGTACAPTYRARSPSPQPSTVPRIVPHQIY